MSQTPGTFSDYRWTYYGSLEEGAIRSRAELFLSTVDWQALQQYAAKKRNGVSCRLLPDVGLGGNHMVRILEFEDGARWVARLQLPSLSPDSTENSAETMEMGERDEYVTMSAVRQGTSIPVPEVHAFEPKKHSDVKAPFMLMDCLPGNVGMDLGMSVPSLYKQDFMFRLARIHVELSMIQLPKIGKIIAKNEDGTYLQGPIPGLGGPFDTAAEFFEAWAAKAEFGMTDERLRAASGKYADEISASVSSFPARIRKLAARLSSYNNGPFPLCHGDFGHNNVVVDDEYRILGLIDWEMAFAAPWEVCADFPLTFSMVPPAMDAPWNYNEEGEPVSPELLEQLADQKSYISAVKQNEEEMRAGHRLSDTLSDGTGQQIVTAMRLFRDGKLAWYSKLIDKFEQQL